jgi:uncharacterized RDD family membrane protein YckC
MIKNKKQKSPTRLSRRALAGKKLVLILFGLLLTVALVAAVFWYKSSSQLIADSSQL